MEAYPQGDEDYAYEHDVRDIIEKPKKGTSVMSFYDTKTKTWEVTINFGDYIFNGTVSPEGVPTNGVIVHDNEAINFNNNEKLSSKGFVHTIMCIFQDKINERYQEDYEEEEGEEKEEERQYNRFEANRKEKRQRTTTEYQNAFGGIQEQEHESDSDEEGNVIHENTINENPTQPTQQPQNQSNLNLKSGQSQQFGRGWNK